MNLKKIDCYIQSYDKMIPMTHEKGETELSISKDIEAFISHPENTTLYRGESEVNKKGLHFTTSKEWAGTFGKTIISGTLPVGSKVRIITDEDMESAMKRGATSEKALWEYIFASGWDAIVGYDSMNSKVLDVIVNPIHLERFK